MLRKLNQNAPKMSSYSKIKKLDEESLQKLKEGSGPADECICSILRPESKKGLAASVKKVFGALSKGRKGGWSFGGNRSVEIPFASSKDQPGIHTTTETVKRRQSCGKCGCDGKKFVLRHSYANIRITTPDVSSVCPCPSKCWPDKEKLQNNLKVIVEKALVNPSPNFGRTSEK